MCIGSAYPPCHFANKERYSQKERGLGQRLLYFNLLQKKLKESSEEMKKLNRQLQWVSLEPVFIKLAGIIMSHTKLGGTELAEE